MLKNGLPPVCSVSQESPQAARLKQLRHEKTGRGHKGNCSSDYMLDSKSALSTQRHQELDSHARLVHMIETKYVDSKLRLYRFPGLREPNDKSDASLQSLKKAGKYNLRAQNSSRPEQAGPTLQQLDFTKLLKRRGKPLNSEREAMVTRIDLQNICPSSRHQKSGIFTTEKRSPSSQKHDKRFNDTFLKGFLRRINLKKDKEVKPQVVKKNLTSTLKLKAPFNPPQRDKSTSQAKQHHETTLQKRLTKQPTVVKEISRRDMLLQYLKDCRVSIEKLKPKQEAEKFHKPGRSTCQASSKNSHRDRAAFSSMALEKPTQLSKTQKSCQEEIKKPQKRYQKSHSFKKSSRKLDSRGHGDSDSVVRQSKSFHKERQPSKNISNRSKSRSKEHDQSTTKQSKGLFKSKCSTKFTAITKLVINNQKAYLHFDDRPKSDRFF